MDISGEKKRKGHTGSLGGKGNKQVKIMVAGGDGMYGGDQAEGRE